MSDLRVGGLLSLTGKSILLSTTRGRRMRREVVVRKGKGCGLHLPPFSVTASISPAPSLLVARPQRVTARNPRFLIRDVPQVF